jgi:hypothetical protein
MNTDIRDAPEGWVWLETATPGELRLMRLGTGYPTLCLLNGNLTVIDPREHTTVLPKNILDALFGAQTPEPGNIETLFNIVRDAGLKMTLYGKPVESAKALQEAALVRAIQRITEASENPTPAEDPFEGMADCEIREECLALRQRAPQLQEIRLKQRAALFHLANLMETKALPVPKEHQLEIKRLVEAAFAVDSVCPDHA